MLRKLMLMAIGGTLALGVALSSLAQDVFQATTVFESLDIGEMVLLTEDGQTYRLSPESVPDLAAQQSSGQLKTGTVILISGHYGRTRDGVPEPYVERIEALSP
jgi:hypothetical protein